MRDGVRLAALVAEHGPNLWPCPAANIHLLEESFPLDCAPIIEPIACALRGIEQLKPRADSSSIIFGAGTMGMLLALLLEMRGVGPIVVVEINETRAEIARRLLPATIIHPDALDKLEAELVIDATGDTAAIEAAVERTAPGGTMLIFWSFRARSKSTCVAISHL